MTAWYNEIDEYAAQWLRNLIEQGLIPDGEVDTRSIVDVRAADLVGFEQCHFFAGIGGWPLALRLASFPDLRPVWTGSCPCQPFSLAGKQKGFADDRHLWPVWRELIRERRPATVYGEQVASASSWLRLVRSDLETMGYAVGAIPVEAASAGADHLRDRYWFVANAPDGRREVSVKGMGYGGGEARSQWRPQTDGTARFGAPVGVGLADANRARPQGRPLLPERAGEWPAGADGMADADQSDVCEEWQQRSRELCGAGCDPEPCDSGRDLADAAKPGCEARAGDGIRVEPGSGEGLATRQGGALDWVIGADGKARRVKSGIRLLAHGVPARVAKLRAFGNAIVPQVAAAFIRSTMTKD